ncbi:hypothetical protein [Micromonospora zhanjiangensis]
MPARKPGSTRRTSDGRASAYVTVTAARVSAVRSSTSSPMNTWTTTVAASPTAEVNTRRQSVRAPPAGRAAGSAARTIRTIIHTITGIRNCAVMCRWLLDWETMPGPKPHSPAPSPAASGPAPRARR